MLLTNLLAFYDDLHTVCLDLQCDQQLMEAFSCFTIILDFSFPELKRLFEQDLHVNYHYAYDYLQVMISLVYLSFITS